MRATSACAAEGSAAGAGWLPRSHAKPSSPTRRHTAKLQALPFLITASLVRRAADQHLPAADVVRATDVSVGLHPLDQPGGAVVADAHLALQIAGRSLALLRDDLERLRVLRVLTVLGLAERQAERAAFRVQRALVRHRVDIVGLALLTQIGRHPLDLLVGDEWPVDARDALARPHEQ